MSNTLRMINSLSMRRAVALSLFGAALSFALLFSPRPINLTQPAAAQGSECQSGVGGRLFATGGQVEVEMLPADAGFTTELHLVSPGPDRLIATNRDAGTIVRLGSFSAGTELIFGVLVRETQQRFVMGPGSANPDGLPHAEVSCFTGHRANVGFEDQLGGGDRDYNDLLCSVRQTDTCSYSLSSTSQSFDSRGGTGSIAVTPSSGCAWSATSNANWIVITSGGSGSSSGTLNYSVAANSDTGSRSGSISIQAMTFTVYQDGIGSLPLITGAVRDGKRLMVYGINFDSGSVLLINGELQKTKHDSDNLTTVVIGKKAGKWVQPGDSLRVQNGSGVTSAPYSYNPQP